MLYRPKFCSPSLAAEQKCFKYISNNLKDYEFSCICDGDELVKEAKITFKFSDETYEQITPYDPYIYPINNKGEYNIFRFYGPDIEINNNEHFFWTVTLFDKDGNSTTSFEQETFIANPKIIWLDVDKNQELESNNQDDPILIDTNKIHIKSGLDAEYPYKIQYWYYKIYEDNANILIYESKKIFSQEIDFAFEQFINNTVYRVELYIFDTVNQEWKTENYFQSNYDIYENSAELEYRLITFDTGVYLKWNNISMNTAKSSSSNDEENLKKIYETDSNGNTVNSQQVYCFTGNNLLTLDKINLNTRGIYGCLRIPEYNPTIKNYCHFYAYDNNLNKDLPSVQLFIERESENNLVFKTSTSTGGNISLENNSSAWVSFYWDFELGKIAAYLLQSGNGNIVSMTIDNQNNDIKDGVILSEGVYNIPNGVLNPLISSQKITLNKLAINGIGTQMAYLFAVKPNVDIITIDEENNKITTTSVLSYLTALNIQPFWNCGLAALDKVENGGTIDVISESEKFANNFVFCLNFENNDLYKDQSGMWKFDSKNPYLLGDPIYRQKIKQMIVKRKALDEQYFKTIATLDYKEGQESFNLIDYSALSGNTYEYVLFPVSVNQQYQSPIYSTPIKVDWDRWVLMVCDETDNENELTLDQVYLFDLNIKSGSMSNNNKKTVIENFTPYPRVQSSPSCFWSGSLSGLLGYLTEGSIQQYKQTPTMLKEFKNLSLNRKRKFLKDKDGNLFEIEISGALSIENIDNLIIDLKTKKIDWVEVANADNISITFRDNRQFKWLLTENGYANPLYVYEWKDEAKWIDQHFWTGG